MSPESRPLRSEDVDAHLNEVLDDMERLGRASSEIAVEKGLATGEQRYAVSYREELFESMKAHIADELPVARPLKEGEEIEEPEYLREIAKRALANLKLPALRDVAREEGLPTSGNQSDLLDRLVTHLRADLERVTTVLLRFETEPKAGRRHATWLYPVVDVPSAKRVESVMRGFVGRYLRTGLAQWFVFEAARRLANEVVVNGSLRTYRVTLGSHAVLEDADATPRLNTQREDHPVQLAIRGGQQVLRASARARPEADAAATAFTYATEAERVDALYHVQNMPKWRAAGQWHPQTVWLLALLRSLLDDSELRLAVVTSAAFERSAALEEHPPADAPHVRTLRLQGRHVLDSPVACHYLSRGEHLTTVTLMLDASIDGAYVGEFPVRISVEGDELAVMTGFGPHGPRLARQVQERLVDRVGEHLIRLDQSRRAITDLLDQIEARADDSAPPRADLFGRNRGDRVELVKARQ